MPKVDALLHSLRGAGMAEAAEAVVYLRRRNAELERALRTRQEQFVDMLDTCDRAVDGLNLPLECADREMLVRWTDAITCILKNHGLTRYVVENGLRDFVSGKPLLATQEPARQPCEQCGGTGELDSGGTMPWGAPAMQPCPSCRPAESAAQYAHVAADAALAPQAPAQEPARQEPEQPAEMCAKCEMDTAVQYYPRAGRFYCVRCGRGWSAAAPVSARPPAREPHPCDNGCQYAKDIAMPEHTCGNGCMYDKCAAAQGGPR